MIVPLRIALVGFVMANDAAGGGAQLAVPGHMARHASDDSAFNTSLCFGGSGSEYNAEDGNSKNDGLHGGSPGKKSLQQFGLQKIVPSIIDISQAAARCAYASELRAAAKFDDLAIRALRSIWRARGSNETVTFGYPRERLF